MVLDFGLLNSGLFKTSSADGDGFGGDEQTQISGGEDKYYSISGGHFIADNPDTDAINYNTNGAELVGEADNIILIAPLNLPHGAIIKSVTVYGDSVTHSWHYIRIRRNGTATALASGVMGATDTTIDDPQVNNIDYSYGFIAATDTGDKLWGALIIYTEN